MHAFKKGYSNFVQKMLTSDVNKPKAHFNSQWKFKQDFDAV